jgi:FkbM family methyltransferase
MGMAIKKPVIVMALYDIGRDNWDNFNLSYNTYLFWMRNTLSLDSHFVIYTEPKFYDKIVEYRKEFDFDLKKTIIIVTPLEELDCYKKYNTILEDLMYSDSFKKKDHHKVPETCKPLYNIIMFNKLNFLKNTKDCNYFDADFLIWADAGGLRNNLHEYKNEIWPSIDEINQLDSNKITHFSHTSDFNIDNNEFHSMSQIRNIQGTSFFVPAHMIDDFVYEFNQTIEESISQGFIGSDEKVFDITYCKNKNKYNLIKCGWREYFNIFKSNKTNNMKKVFLDLGTHECQGLHHFIYNELKMDDKWEIHTFEPNSLIDVESCIKSNFHVHNITIHRKAVWIRDAFTVFKRYGENGKSQGSLLSDTNGGYSYEDFYDEDKVECIDFYNFLKTLNHADEIYIKMDIEWSEYPIIEDMLVRGWPSNIKHMWIEWHGRNETFFINKSDFLMEQIRLQGCGVTLWH